MIPNTIMIHCRMKVRKLSSGLVISSHLKRNEDGVGRLDRMIAAHRIDPEFEAILGHMSAHSLATGPATADPFISPLLLTITAALSSK